MPSMTGMRKSISTNANRSPPASACSLQRLVFHCLTTSASTAPCTSRRMCCPAHCASYCAPCQPLLRAFFEWIQSPPRTLFSSVQHAVLWSISAVRNWLFSKVDKPELQYRSVNVGADTNLLRKDEDLTFPTRFCRDFPQRGQVSTPESGKGSPKVNSPTKEVVSKSRERGYPHF